MTDLKKEFGKRLKAIRKERGISQTELAGLIPCETNTISNIERGIHGPRFDLFEKIAAVLKAHPRDFFDFTWPQRKRK